MQDLVGSLTILWGKCEAPHFTDIETEAWRGDWLIPVASGSGAMCSNSLSCVLSATKHPLSPKEIKLKSW